jgi:hypothetical protein
MTSVKALPYHCYRKRVHKQACQVTRSEDPHGYMATNPRYVSTHVHVELVQEGGCQAVPVLPSAPRCCWCHVDVIPQCHQSSLYGGLLPGLATQCCHGLHWRQMGYRLSG